MTDITILSSSDLFFYYGKNALELEIEAEVLQGIIQSKKSMFYFRGEGCGVNDYENYPNGFAMQVQIRYEIVKWSSYRNEYISDGSLDSPDRRVATSQNAVSIESNNNEVNIDVLYIPYYNYKKPAIISLPVGVQ